TLLTGVGGGHDIDFRDFARDGVVLLGRIVAARENKLGFASDLEMVLARGDECFASFVKSADEYVQRNGLDLPNKDRAGPELPHSREMVAPIRELDLNNAGISS